MSVSQILQQLYSLDTSSLELSRHIRDLIRRDEKEQYLSRLQGPELARLVDFLDEALSVIPTTDDAYRKCLHKLQVVCGHHMVLPSSYIVSGDLTKVGDYPIAQGGFADVWEGTHCGRDVCVKQLRISLSDPALEKSFFKEVVIWKRLRHPNIVPFIGVTMKPLQIVSEWMPNGTLTRYVKKHPSANRIGLLLDVAEGLSYLHGNHTIHGDLKGPNILVDRDGRARLADFGFASIVRGMSSIQVTQPQGYTAEWTAPEILMETCDRITKEADMFSFGMVVVEAFTGMHPFNGFKPWPVALKIIKGERPSRPQGAEGFGLVDPVWDMTLRCWQQEPTYRPAVAEVVGLLHECYTLRTENPYLATTSPSESSTPTQSRETFRYSSQPSSQSHGTPADLCSVSSDGSRVFTKSSDYSVVLDSGSIERRVDEIAKELADGTLRPGRKSVIELRRLCGLHRTIPTFYNLEGVVKEGDHAECTSQTTEVWKGRYNGEAVALKVLRVHRDDYLVQITRSRFCKEAVLMMQLEHDNIIPFYGVSADVSDFCLVFPWYENGNIVDYLSKRPDVNRFVPLSNAANGLRFLHENNLIHGALRPSHILIDDSGIARLATADCRSIVAVPDASFEDYVTIGEYIHEHQYSAPEIRRPEDYGMYKSRVTRESDVYGMGVIVYEVLTGNLPYSKHGGMLTLSKIHAGGIPQRPFRGIDDSVWGFLEKCWSRDPAKRPSATEVFNALSQFYCPLPAKRLSHTDNRRTVPIPDAYPGKADFEARMEIDEISEELARGNLRSSGKTVIELRRLCGYHQKVPTAYQLEGVTKEGARPQWISQVSEIWKGRYNDEAVALKVLRVPQDDPHEQKTKSRFCKKVVLMKQLRHENILPFYGISARVSDFCMVFPWYENGNIMEYLKKQPDADRFALLLNAASGLRFLHEHHLVHGALRPGHMLIDDHGAVRLAAAGRYSIMAGPGNSGSGEGYEETGVYANKHRYSAPETLWPEDHGMLEILMTKESDVYGMSMVAYEVLTGRIPYSEYDDMVVILSKIRAGARPQRPSGGISDTFWELLENCWSGVPAKRPSATQIYDAFSEPRSLVQGTLSLQIQSIKITLDKPGRRRFSVRIKYGNNYHTTSPTTKVIAGDEYLWSSPEIWLIETDIHNHGQLFTFEVIRLFLGGAEVCATGQFSPLGSVNKHCRVKLEVPGNTSRPATLKIFLA